MTAMMTPIQLDGRFYVLPAHVAAVTGVGLTALWNWAKVGATSYGYPLTVRVHGSRRFLDERDARIVAMVQREYPLAAGRGRPAKRAEMKRYAEHLRATLPALAR